MPLPSPPPEGWTLLQAVQALCPNEWTIFNGGGKKLAEAIEKALINDLRYDPFLTPNKHNWISDCLTRTIAHRNDLDITGINLADGLQSSRVSVPLDLVKLAAQNQKNPSVWLDLAFEENSILMSLKTLTFLPDIEDYAYKECKLHSVRVKLIPRIVSEKLNAQPKKDTQPQFSLSHLAAWYVLRVAGWPKDKPPPTEKDDQSAAEAEYGCKISRTVIRKIRREKGLPHWLKRGPRGPRNFRHGSN